MHTPRLIFNKASIPFILEALDKTVDENGIIKDKASNKPITDKFGSNVHISTFGGIFKGVFVNGDLFSIMDLAESIKKQ